MLDHAASRQGPDDRIEWRQADTLELPFDDQSFDVVICQYGAMFYPDRTKGYAEAHRVLREGGRFICSVWDRIENNKFADVVTKAAATVFPDGPALFTARTPHGHFDHDLIRADLNRAGFTDIVINSKEETSKAPSARHAAIALCQGTPRRSEIETRDGDSLEHVMEVAAAALEAICGKDAVAAKISAHIVTAVK